MLLLSLENCQSLPHFEHYGFRLSNNSFIFFADIGAGDVDGAIKCVADDEKCCHNSTVDGWRDESGRPVYQGADGVACLYVTRGDGVISLNQKAGCTDHTSGLWRCDIPDSSGEMQSLYAYISNRKSYGTLCYFPASFLLYIITGQLNSSVSMNFTLHTESVPEFTISCRTHGGPATTVQWTVNGVSVQEDRYHETSQLILDTSLNSVYDNRLRVRGRRSGTYNCTISNNIRDYLDEDDGVSVTQVNRTLNISGNVLTNYISFSSLRLLTVTREPSNLNAVTSESNSNITVSWESPGDPVTGYVICYQPKGGPVISDRVSGGETDTHSLDGLQRGVTYYISIVALSPHLPSPLVGPITVIASESLTSPSSHHVLMSLSH